MDFWIRGLQKAKKTSLDEVLGNAMQCLLSLGVTSITPVLRELRWLTVTQQLYLRDAVFTFKCMTGCAPDYLRSKLVTRGQASGRVTRNSQQLNIPLFRTATGQRSFQYRAVSLWNSSDNDLKLSKNHEVFKRKLKHILWDT